MDSNSGDRGLSQGPWEGVAYAGRLLRGRGSIKKLCIPGVLAELWSSDL